MKRYRTLPVVFGILRVHAFISVQTPTGDGALKPLTQFDTAFYVQSLLELHRQVCPVDKYSNLVVLRLSDEALLQAILPQIISDQTYKKTVSDRAELFHTYANDFYSCNFIPIDSLVHLNVRTSAVVEVQFLEDTLLPLLSRSPLHWQTQRAVFSSIPGGC